MNANDEHGTEYDPDYVMEMVKRALHLLDVAQKDVEQVDVELSEPCEHLFETVTILVTLKSGSILSVAITEGPTASDNNTHH